MRDPPLILVVDDVADNVDILQMRLEAQGYQVTTAGDGVEALEKVGELLPDLVLLDVIMPKLDGIETVKRLKADPFALGRLIRFWLIALAGAQWCGA